MQAGRQADTIDARRQVEKVGMPASRWAGRQAGMASNHGLGWLVRSF